LGNKTPLLGKKPHLRERRQRHILKVGDIYLYSYSSIQIVKE